MRALKDKFYSMILADLDGTILNDDKQIGKSDFETLEKLGNLNITRVFATGRNMYSALNVLPVNTPIDYLIFSSGAGILDWKTRQLLFRSAIPKKEVDDILTILKGLGTNFAIQFPIPDNHKYYYFKGKDSSLDFDKRNMIYSQFNFELVNGFPLDSATQFLVILPDDSNFEFIASHLKNHKVIRATSPIDGKSVWLEIFNTNVSKALGAKFLCDKLNINYSSTIGVGNDYNDLDLLDWTAKSFIVENAPEILRQKFNYCPNNQSNPISFIYKNCFG